MAVSIRYAGRLGNNIFQYAFARMFAEDHDLLLETPWPWLHWIQTTPCTSGAQEVGKKCQSDILFDDENPPDGKPIYNGTTNYVFDGYFQNADRYRAHRDRIRNYFRFPLMSFRPDGHIQLQYHWAGEMRLAILPNDEDLGIHVRLTDGATLGNENHIVHPDWYDEILSKEAKNYRRIVVITDDIFARDMFKVFEKYKATVKSQTVPEDFMELMTFKHIIQAPSTFSWMASFLGHAEKIWQHSPFVTLPNVKLTLPDAIQVRGGYINGRAR